MRKIVAAINVTIDGFCDHTAGVPDEAIHQHYTDLLSEGDAILYGRVTFQLMEYWRTLLEKPSGEKEMDDFAVAIDRIPKIVFSRTLKSLDWKTATLATRSPEDEVLALREQPGKTVFIGSPSLISSLTALNLIDEYQLCVHPVIAGSGLRLFKDQKELEMMKLIRTKVFDSGAVILYYEKK